MRFTIRELLLVTVVVGMGVGWTIHSAQLRKELKALRSKYEYLVNVADISGLTVAETADGRVQVTIRPIDWRKAR